MQNTNKSDKKEENLKKTAKPAEKNGVFRTALKELVGSAPAAEAPSGTPKTAPAATLPSKAAAAEAPATKAEKPQSNSVLAGDLLITGKVESQGNIIIDGTVKGDVLCAGKLTVRGSILGNLEAQTIEMQGSKVKGEVVCKGALTIDEKSVLVGNVQSGDAQISGKIRGNITSGGMLEIAQTAVVLGDLHFDAIELHKGAVISGLMICSLAENNISELEFDLEEK